MSEMIERVAKAIWDNACPGMVWGEIDKLTYMGWAREAIKAMREPTVEMLTAAYRTVGVPEKPVLANGYRAMIDAAISAER